MDDQTIVHEVFANMLGLETEDALTAVWSTLQTVQDALVEELVEIPIF
jgi:hypothetical protein